MLARDISLRIFSIQETFSSLFIFSTLLLSLSGCSHSASSPSSAHSIPSALENVPPLEGKELFLHGLKDLHQHQQLLEGQFMEAYNQLKQLSSLGPKEEKGVIPQEMVQKYQHGLKELAHSLISFSKKVESTQSIGQSYFDSLEEKAKELTDMDQQSNRYREIIKFRRKFRLFYLNMKQLNTLSLALFKSLRHQGLELMSDPNSSHYSSAEGSLAKDLKVSLQKAEMKLKEFRNETESSKTHGETFIHQFISKGP